MADKIEKTVETAVETEEAVEKTAKKEASKPAKAVEKKEPEMEQIRIPFDGKETTMFVSLNFKNYVLKRGEYVTVPKEVAEIIKESVAAEEAAKKFALETEEEYMEKARKFNQ